MKVYIASPIFSESDNDQVTKIERKLTERGITYFSPRDIGKFERDHNNPIYHLDKATIVHRNIEELEDADRLVVNFKKDEKGNYDMGTLFELGYFVGKQGLMRRNDYRNGNKEVIGKYINEFLYPVFEPGDYPIVEECIEFLINLSSKYNWVTTEESGKHFYDGHDAERTTALYHAGNMEYIPEISGVEVIDITEIGGEEAEFVPADTCIVNIDDRSIFCTLLIGFLAGIRSNCSLAPHHLIGTNSLKGYGSNIMIQGAVDFHSQIEDGDLIINYNILDESLIKDLK